jgi:uncharacterized damage-inducible protein DinB
MEAVTLVRRLHHHRTWANRQLLAAAQELADEHLRRELPIGQGSLWKTLCHLHAAEYVWLDALLGKDQSLAPGDVAGKLPGNQEGENAVKTLAELDTRWAELDGRWGQYLESLTNEQLDEIIYKVRSTGGRYAFRRADILVHVCTHAHYTVAQANNMLRHVGAKSIPDPMMITLARSEPPLE